MKKYLFSLAAVSLLLASCGGLESQVEDIAEKKCECKSLDGDKKDACKKELKEMEEEFEKELKEAELKPSEEDELKKVYKDKLSECKD